MKTTMNYDPNLTNSGRMAIQLVKLTFASWEYRGQMTIEVGGNCTGLTVIKSAVGSAFDALDEKRESERRPVAIVLTNETGDTLTVEDDDNKGEDWLSDMCIGAEIVSIKPK